MIKKIYKKLIDSDDYYKLAASYVNEQPRFNIGTGSGLFKTGKRKICNKVLNPLIPSIVDILIYELNTDRKEVKKYNPYLSYKNGRHVLELKGKKWQYFLSLLYKPRLFSTIHEIRGSILIKILNKDIPWKDILKYCYGPYIMDNPSVGCGKTALKYSKRNADDQHVFIIIEKVNSGLESITITGEKKSINNIFQIAAKSCTYI